MTYRIEFRRAGAVIRDSDEAVDRAGAKRIAEQGFERHDADLAQLIDVTGTGVEAASIRRDTMVWDDE